MPGLAGWSREKAKMKADLIGHNVEGGFITVEARLFNSLYRHRPRNSGDGRVQLAAGSTVGDLVTHLGLAEREIYLVMRNGRDITRSLYEGINTDAVLEDGDVIAFSGPVPYSWGYGAPVV